MKKLTKADIPEGYKYAAVNLDGKAYAYKEKPLMRLKYIWLPSNFKGLKKIEGNFDYHDWKNSLISIHENETN